MTSDFLRKTPLNKSFYFSNKNTIIAIFIIMLADLFQIRSSIFALQKQWQTNELVINYSYGFVRRGLLGSIVNLMSNLFNISYDKAIVFFGIIGEIAFVCILLLFTVKVIKTVNNSYFNFLVLLAFGMHIFGFYFYDWAEPDIFIIILTVFMCALVIKDRFLLLIPILASACVCIHEGYVLMHFCIVCAILIYKIAAAKETKKRIYYITVFGLTGITVGGLFGYFYFLSNNYINVDSNTLLNNVTDIVGERITQKENLFNVFYGIGEYVDPMWLDGKPTVDFYKRMIAALMILILCSPIIVLIARFWKKVIKHEQSSLLKAAYIVGHLFLLLNIPMIIFKSDHGRWFYCFVFFELFVISTLASCKCEAVCKALEDYSETKLKHVLMIIIYFIIFVFPNKQFISKAFVILFKFLFRE